MQSRVTKAAGNRYCQARLKAAKYNEKLLTRAGAVDYLPGVTEDSLKKYELDITKTPNTVVALMADAYAEPELRAWYCANECPLGKDRIAEISDMPPERCVLRMRRHMDDMQDALTEFAEIVEDGVITPEELEMVPEIKKRFTEARQKVDEMLAAIEKIEARKGYPDGEKRCRSMGRTAAATKEPPKFLRVADVAAMLDISESHAYKIMRQLNKELEAKGKIVTAGRVSRRYLEERMY